MINLDYGHNRVGDSDAFYIMLTIILFTIVFMMLIIVLGFLVFQSIELYKALKNLNYEHPIFAFIPFANYYAMASVCDEVDGNVEIIGFKIDAQLFRLWWLINIGLAFIPVVGSFLAVAVRIICLGTCYTNIYKKLENKKSDSLKIRGYFSFILLVSAICLFISNREYKNRINYNVDLSKY